MRLSRQIIIVLVATIAPVVMIAIGLMHIKKQYDTVVENVRVVVEGEMEHYFDREARVGDATILPLGSVVLKDVALADGKLLSDGKVFSADRIVVRWSVEKAKSGYGIKAIEHVSIHGLEANVVRRKDGSFNISELAKEGEEEELPQFVGDIRVHSATINYTDYLIAEKRPAKTITLSGFDATLKGERAPKYTFFGSANGPEGKIGKLEFFARHDASDNSLSVNGSVKDVSLPFAADYSGLLPSAVKVKTGMAQLSGRLIVAPDSKKPKISAVVDVTDLQASSDFVKEPVRDIGGRITVVDERVAMRLQGQFAGSNLNLAGALTGLEDPSIKMIASSGDLDYSRVIRSVPGGTAVPGLRLSGKGPAVVEVTGPVANPQIGFEMMVPQVGYTGYMASNVSLAGSLDGDTVNISKASLKAYGGDVLARGTVDTSKMTAKMNVRVQEVDLNTISLARNQGVSGTLDAELFATGNILKPEADFEVAVTQGSVKGTKYSSIKTVGSYKDKRINLAKLEIAGVFDGTVRASGTLAENNIDLSASVEDIDLEKARKDFGIKDRITGTLYANARVKGTPLSPSVEGSMELFKGSYNDLPVDYATIAGSYNGKKIVVKEATLRSLPAEIGLTATATLQNNSADFTFDTSVSGLEMEKISRLTGQDIDVTGTIIADFEGSGKMSLDPAAGINRFSQMNATGTATLEYGTALGYPIDNASAKIDFSGDIIRLQRVFIDSQESIFTAEGELNQSTNEIDLAVELAGFDLVRLDKFIGDYMSVGGTAYASGKIFGEIDDPEMVFLGRIERPLISRTLFEQADFEMEYRDGAVKHLASSLSRGDEKYTFSLDNYQPETGTIDEVYASLDNASIPELWDIFRTSPYVRNPGNENILQIVERAPQIREGKLNGELEVELTTSGPKGMMDLVATDLLIDIRHFEKIKAQAVFDPGTVILKDFEAISQDVVISAQGDPAYTYLIVAGTPQYAMGSVDITADVHNVNLGDLSPWLGSATPSGTMFVTTDIMGPWNAPEVMGSVEVIEPGFGGVTFDSLRATRINTNEGKIQFPEVILSVDEHELVADGYVPWDWTSLSVPNDKPLSLAMRLKNPSLDFVSSLTDKVDSEETEGEMSFDFAMSGTMNEPSMSGGIKLEDGRFALNSFGNSFENVQVDTTFTGSKVLVNEFSAESSEGGKAYIRPESYIDFASGDGGYMDFKLFAEDLAVEARNMTPLREDVDVELNAGLSIEGKPAKPLISNANTQDKPSGVVIDKGTIGFEIPDEVAGVPQFDFPIDPSFDVTMRLGEEVEVQPPLISMWTSGGGHLRGTLSKPDVALLLDINGGQLRLADTRIKVLPGGTINVTYAPPREPRIVVNFEGYTFAYATDQFGKRSRYQILVSVSGPVDNMKIGLESVPGGLSRSQMLAALGHMEGIFTDGEVALHDELAQALRALGTSALFAPLEQVFVEELGFEQFSLEYDKDAAVSIFFSKPLFDNFYLTYFQSLGGVSRDSRTKTFELKLGYRYRRSWQVNIGTDDQSGLIFDVSYTQSF